MFTTQSKSSSKLKIEMQTKIIITQAFYLFTYLLFLDNFLFSCGFVLFSSIFFFNFSLSCRAVLVKISCLRFCLSRNILISPSFLRMPCNHDVNSCSQIVTVLFQTPLYATIKCIHSAEFPPKFFNPFPSPMCK